MSEISLVVEGWAASGATRARGYAHLNNHFLRAEALAAAIDACTTDAEWQRMVGRLNGCFAVVTRRAGNVLAAVDRLRSIPLFYALRGGTLLLGDNASNVLQALGAREIDPEADAEFRLTGYVTGRETLYRNVHQLVAGEHLRFDPSIPDAIERRQYYAFRHDNFFAESVPELISRLEGVHAAVFRRLVDSCDGRTIAIPLSGGYDSRLIGISLRDLGVRDVVCYSYGVPGNWESRISEELARYLGFRWEFVPYSAERWRAWAATERFGKYFREAGNLTSVPHVQDWPAVLELHSSRRLPPDSVIVPGHSGDFLAGSHIPKSYSTHPTISRSEVLDSLLTRHYSLWDWPRMGRAEMRTRFERRIESIVGPIDDSSPEAAADVFERWDLQERQAKFICNSVRVYESFGLEWRLPLFDCELMDFWARVPVALRSGRRLYFEFTKARQALPITEANKDHGALTVRLLEAVEAAGLRPAAKRVQRILRKIRWKRQYLTSPLAWMVLVDRDVFRRTYTGKELIHSYLTLRYRDLVR